MLLLVPIRHSLLPLRLVKILLRSAGSVITKNIEDGALAITRAKQKVIKKLCRKVKRCEGKKIMCGIVGMIGKNDVALPLLECLKRLEYRGYDSAGIATIQNGFIERRRAEGKLINLAALDLKKTFRRKCRYWPYPLGDTWCS